MLPTARHGCVFARARLARLASFPPTTRSISVRPRAQAMRFPFFALAAQIPFHNSPYYSTFSPIDPAPTKMDTLNSAGVDPFKFREGPDVFSPKDLVELTRPGQGVANPSGDLVLVPVTKYSFDNNKNQKSIYIAPLESTVSPLHIPLARGGEAFWLDDRTVAHVVESSEPQKHSSTTETAKKDKEYNPHLEIYAISVEYTTDSDSELTPRPPQLLGTLPTTTSTSFTYNPASNRLVFSDKVYPDGSLYTVHDQDKEWEERGNSAMVFDELYERHWDEWNGGKRNSIFEVSLVKSGGKWVLGEKARNLLKGSNHSSPVEPFGGSDDFAVSATHVLYTAKDPFLPEAWHTKQNIYILPISGGKPRELTSGSQGATHAPALSTSGDKAAWVELDEDGNEADRAKVVIYDLERGVRFTITQGWDRSVESLAFSKDDSIIYFTAGDHARVKVYALPVPPTPQTSTTHPSLSPVFSAPPPITATGASGGIHALPSNRLLFSRSSLTGPNDVWVVGALPGVGELESYALENENGMGKEKEEGWLKRMAAKQVTRFAEEELASKSLDPGESFYFRGSEDREMQGWVLKPPGFEKSSSGDAKSVEKKKKWPVVLLIHGGPQSAWEDQWSTRWNPNVFAQQGYFVVAINPTGSTTFGQNLTDGISGDWGGKPFEDLVKGWKYILGEYPEIDEERAVAAGASWGGYAINWIQGHPEYGFNFKALVCHDGVFDANYNGYSTDELFFFNHEWGGRPWEPESKRLSSLYSPSNYVDKWSTPQLIIHGSKDFRLPETEGLAAFHALQQRGIESRLVIFPDENHWVLNHGNSLKWHYEVFRWFDKYVGEKK